MSPSTTSSVPGNILHGAIPIFLIGCPRSGTTFLTKLLSSHRELLLTNESAVFMLLDDIIKKADQGIRSGILFGKDYHKHLSALLASSYRELIERFYSTIAMDQQRSRLAYWGEKHPHLFMCLERVDEMFPDARYIYAVRDPRDSSLSIGKMTSNSFENALDNWKKFSDRYEEFVSGKGADRVLVTRYEDMVADYRAETDRILAWLGLETSSEVVSFLDTSKSIDAHSEKHSHDFLTESVGRWRRMLSQDQDKHASELVGSYLSKYGYHIGQEARVADDSLRACEKDPQPVVEYRCNICGKRNSSDLSSLDRESRSCVGCGSSVRMRAMIHLLSEALFGDSLCVSDFPVRRDIKGIGLSDWGVYARQLAKRLDYTNTYYHQEPRVDITSPDGSLMNSLDFVIASDVFEHVMAPVSAAFVGARRVLRPGGALVFSVPFQNKGAETLEHFPSMAEADIRQEDGRYRLYATNLDGTVEVHDNLRFHGGPGSTLEMRIFTRASMLHELHAAGFSRVRIMDEPVPKWGIYWKVSWSLPLIAIA